jgi:hypothetical protein
MLRRIALRVAVGSAAVLVVLVVTSLAAGLELMRPDSGRVAGCVRLSSNAWLEHTLEIPVPDPGALDDIGHPAHQEAERRRLLHPGAVKSISTPSKYTMVFHLNSKKACAAAGVASLAAAGIAIGTGWAGFGSLCSFAMGDPLPGIGGEAAVGILRRPGGSGWQPRRDGVVEGQCDLQGGAGLTGPRR